MYNYIADSQDGEVGLVDAAETRAANSHAVMIGNVIVSKPRQSGYNSGRFIQFGQDSGGDHNGILLAFNNTFVVFSCGSLTGQRGRNNLVALSTAEGSLYDFERR